MKIQRKLLTKKQKLAICKKHKAANNNFCIGCPLFKDMRIGQSILSFCYPKDVDKLKKFIEEFGNEEIEVDFGNKSPWVSEQDRLEAMAAGLGHELDKLANDMGCE